MNNTSPKSRPRPLSPHIQVYRWLITSTLSILHRLSGVALSFGLLLVVCWLLTAAYHPENYEAFKEFLGSPLGIIMLGGWSLAMYYHLCNGIRHLFWDMGKGFDLKNVNRSGITVIVAAVVLTALTWLYGLGVINGTSLFNFIGIVFDYAIQYYILVLIFAAVPHLLIFVASKLNAKETTLNCARKYANTFTMILAAIIVIGYICKEII